MAKKFSELPQASSAEATDQHAVNQGGVSKTVTGAQMATMVAGLLSLGSLAYVSTIGSSQITDGSVSPADMATGTPGATIVYGAAGVPEAAGPGTATHVLTSNGAGAVPTFQAPAAGYTTEQAQDAVGAMVNASLMYNDGAAVLSLADYDYTDFTCTNAGTVCNIDASAVGASEIGTDAVAADEIASGAVGTDEIATNAVAFADMAQLTGNGVIGNNSSGTANPSFLQPSASDQVLRHDGAAAIGWGTIGSASITDNSLTTADIATTSITSGTYSPTLTNGSNVASSTTGDCHYVRVGSVVTQSCMIEVSATAGSTETLIDLSLTVASTIGSEEDLSGNAVLSYSDGPPNISGAVTGSEANNRAHLRFNSGGAGSHTALLTFSYQVL